MPKAASNISHVVDILGNVIGRDQPILLIERALDVVSSLHSETLVDEQTVFFDPFCKAGELRLACAMQSCKMKWGHSDLVTKRPGQIQSLVEQEIYHSNRYYGLAPDERHYRLSKRTFLGNINSHEERYSHVIRNGDYLSEIDGCLDGDKFAEAFTSMLEYINKSSRKPRIIAIGNPPYQESDGGFGKSAKSIYDHFTQKLIENESIAEFILVIPARWFAGGKGLDEFRSHMIDSKHVKNLRYFQNSSDVFPTVDINGGVCFLHFDKSFDSQLSGSGTVFTDGKHTENVNFKEYDIIPDDPLAFPLVRKLKNVWNEKYVGEVAWAQKPFGLRTNYFDKNPDVGECSHGCVPCLSRRQKIKYVPLNQISKNREYIDHWKVSVAAAAGGSKGKRRSTVPISQIFLVDSGTVATETYNIIDVFESKRHAENLVAYLKTEFVRYFVGLRKITQHVPRDRWNWVPYMDVSKSWTDDELYAYFGFTQEERQHIRNKVEEWS